MNSCPNQAARLREPPRLWVGVAAGRRLMELWARPRRRELRLALQLQRWQTLLPPAPRAQLEWIPSLRRGQRLERPPARVRVHPVRVHRGGDGRGRCWEFVLKQPPGRQALLTRALRKTVHPQSNAICAPVEHPAQPLTQRHPQMVSSRHQDAFRAFVPHQNRRAARAEAQAGRRALPASFCGAASARASIYACKAFNTEERAGSIGGTAGEPRATAE